MVLSCDSVYDITSQLRFIWAFTPIKQWDMVKVTIPLPFKSLMVILDFGISTGFGTSFGLLLPWETFLDVYIWPILDLTAWTKEQKTNLIKLLDYSHSQSSKTKNKEHFCVIELLDTGQDFIYKLIFKFNYSDWWTTMEFCFLKINVNLKSQLLQQCTLHLL